MQKSSKWILAASGLGLLLAMAIPWPFSSDTLNGQIANQISEATGLSTRVNGRSTFALLPTPQIKLRDVVIQDSSGTLQIETAVIKGKLRLLPMVAGRLEVSSLTLQGPTIALDLDSAHIPQTAVISRAGTAKPNSSDAAIADTARLGTIEITNGHARVRRSASTSEIAEFNAVNFVLDWRSPRSPAALSGDLLWQDEKFAIAALVAKPSEMMRGGTTPFALDLKSPLGNLNLDGELSAAPRWQFAGKLLAATTAADTLLTFAKLDLPLPGTLDHASLSGNTRIQSNAVNISALTLNLNDNTFTGTLTVQNDAGKANVTSTLAANVLNFDPRATHFYRLLGSSEGRWNNEPLRLDHLSAVNMDIRLSTASLRVGQMAMGDVAISSIAKDGRLEFSISSAKTYGGSLKGRMSLNADQDIPQLRTFLQFEKLELGTLLRDISGSQRLTGYASGEWELRSNGASILEILQNSNGTIKTTLNDGAIAGMDVDRALRQIRLQPLTLPAEIRNGRTIYKLARINADVEAGLIKIRNSVSESDSLSIVYGGVISLVGKTMSIDIDASRPRLLAPEEPASDNQGKVYPELKLDLSGPWYDPTLRLDAESLINNSEAAAPLTRSLRKPDASPATPSSMKAGGP